MRKIYYNRIVMRVLQLDDIITRNELCTCGKDQSHRLHAVQCLHS